MRQLLKALRGTAAVLVVLLSGGCASMTATIDDGPRVHIGQGEIEGVALPEVHAFLGIPYARPPLGKLRWRTPAEPVPWNGVLSARRHGAACMQGPPRPWGPFTTEFVDVQVPLSEDCLFLNVWTPRARGAKGLPVLVWIHGGGFGSGAASVPIYDGSRLAARGAVVVSINYRLGVFGFLAHPALSAESPQGVSGNYGLLDMVAALRWVRAHIEQFGGSPEQVTIAGQSAGAAAVMDLMAMPSAQGLFKRAIALSGAAMGVRALPLDEAQRIGERMLNEAGIADVASLRQLAAERVQALEPPQGNSSGMPRLVLAPVVDGRVLPVDVEKTPAKLMSPVPVLTGYMADEGFIMGPPPATPASFEAHVRQRYGAMADRFLAAYPHADDAQATASMRLVGRDRYMAALLIWADRREKAGQPVQGYLFSNALPGPDAGRFAAFHTAEIPYLFGTLDRRLRPYTDADEAIAAALQSQVLAFMRDGQLTAPAPAARLTAASPRVVELGTAAPASVPAVSSAQRLQAFIDYEAGGGQLSMF